MWHTSLKKVTVWSSISNGGDGSAFNFYFLTLDEAVKDQEDDDEGWAEECISEIETYVGSNVHQEAVRNSEGE